MAKTYTLTFLRAWGPYNAGESAGFEAKKCGQLITQIGVAKPKDAETYEALLRDGVIKRPEHGPISKPPVSTAVTEPPQAREVPDDGDELSALSYQELLTRAKEVADERGEPLPSKKGERSTDSLIAYIRGGN